MKLFPDLSYAHTTQNSQSIFTLFKFWQKEKESERDRETERYRERGSRKSKV